MAGLENKIVLITGASAGIGAATALHFASIGCRLSLVGRNREHLEEVAAQCRASGSPDVVVVVKDLSTLEGCDEAMADSLGHFNGNFECTSIAVVMLDSPSRAGCSGQQCGSHAYGQPGKGHICPI